LDLTASYGYSQTNPDFDIGMKDPDRALRMGASFSLNLFNGLQNRTKIQNAKIEQKTQKLLREEAQLNLMKDITDAHETYRKALFILQLEKRNLNAAELNFRRTEELFNLGQVTNTQFREAQLNLIRALSNISSAKYTAKLNEIELLRLSGVLIAEGN
jgi:outer membrane protein